MSFGLRVPTPCEVVSSEASSDSERKRKKIKNHCLTLDRSITPHGIGLMLHLFLKYLSQLKFSLDKVTGKRPLVTKISKVWECPRICGNKQPLADYWT
jgi:hypothetical protein